MMTGGLTESKPATPEVQLIVNQVKPQFESRENRTCDLFEAIIYRTQVVAGINYFIKDFLVEKVTLLKTQAPRWVRSGTDVFTIILQVQVSDSEYVHLRVFQSLPAMNEGPSLVSFQTGKTRDDPLTYF